MKKTKRKEEIITNGNILIYDDENIVYYSGAMISAEPKYNLIEYCASDSPTKQFLPDRDWELTATIQTFRELKHIELDAETMKIIAKFNKEIDVKKLDEQSKELKREIKELKREIKKQQSKLKALDDIFKDQKHEKRKEKIKEYVNKVYEIDLDDDYDCIDDDNYWK